MSGLFIFILSNLTPLEIPLLPQGLWMLITGYHHFLLNQKKLKSFMLLPFSEIHGVSLFYLLCLSVHMLF